MTDFSTDPEQGAFFLCPADGHSWRLLADESGARFRDRLAAVMRLGTEGPKNSRNLIFTEREPPKTDGEAVSPPAGLLEIYPHLPFSGWLSRDLGYVIIMTHRDCGDIICVIKDRFGRSVLGPRMWAALSPVARAVVDAGGLVAHSCLYTCNDRDATLLVAPSGTGKSTCSRRLGAPWKAICDDQVLVARKSENLFHAHPMPTWSDLWAENPRSWPFPASLPIRSVFFLHRDQGAEVERIGSGKAAVMLTRSEDSMSFRILSDSPDLAEKRALKRLLFENAAALTSSVPCFSLRAGLTTRFWDRMEQALSECPG